jgi:hypothetical protein
MQDLTPGRGHGSPLDVPNRGCETERGDEPAAEEPPARASFTA